MDDDKRLHSGTDNADCGSPGGGGEELTAVVPSDSGDSADGHVEIIEAEQKARTAELTGQVAVCMSATLTVMSYAAFLYGRLHGIDLSPPDWVVGLILGPFGGAAWMYLKDRLGGKKK